MRCDKHSRIKCLGITSILFIILLANPLTFYTVDVDAQQVSLVVSAAQDPAQNNTFFGPQIVQIVIDDPNARNPDTNTGGLVVKGQQMQRVHLSDGRWYSFIAAKDSFLLFLDVMTDGVRDNKIAVSDVDDADNRNTVDAFSIVFGQADSFVREITEVDGSIFVEVKKKDIFPTLPEPFTGAGTINPDLDINPSSEAAIDWPYIRLFGIQETDIVDIRFGNTSVSLSYAKHYGDIKIQFDRTSYPIDADIIMSFKDFMWNINPVEEDVVRFVFNKSTERTEKVLYQPIRNFDPAGNGVNVVDLSSVLTLLRFDSTQIVKIAGIANLKYKEAFDSSTNSIKEFTAQPGKLISEMTTSELPMVTFIEKNPNVSWFETIDVAKGGKSNIFAGKRDATVNMNYFEIIGSATLGTRDAFASADREIYDSADRAIFKITDIDLNRQSRVSETYNGIDSKAFIKLGNPFPLTNNAFFNTLPKGSDGNFLPNSIQAAVFNTVGGTPVATDNRSPVKTDFLALDFSTADIGMNKPTGFIVNSNVKIADLSSTTTFTMTKKELMNNADPFIRAVSTLKPQVSNSFQGAADNEKITVTFPRYNLIYINLSKLNAVFAKVFVEIEASNGIKTVKQFVDFEPFGEEDVDGDMVFERDPLLGNSGFGSFRILDFINQDWNGDGKVDSADIAQLGNISLKFTVTITDSANTPLPITSTTHQVVLDIGGLGVIRAQGATVDAISVDASEHLVYRLGLKEDGENSSSFSGRVDFMTMLHNDTVQGILRVIQVVGDPLKIWMPNRFIPPNRLALSYTDLDISGAFKQISTTFLYETRDGEVSWDREQYRFSQVAFLTIKDQDLNRRPDAIEQYSIPQDGFLFFEFGNQRADTACKDLTPMPNECIAKFVEATLRETGPNTGEFKAQITMPDRVLLANGDIIRAFRSDIRAVYVDARDKSSNVNEFRASALIRSDIDTSQPEPAPKDRAVAESGSVRIELDKTDYHPYSRIDITVTDPKKNTDRFRSDVIFVKILRQSDNKGLTYKLTETGVNTGIFNGYVDLRGPEGRDGGSGPKGGTLRINANDKLNISFESVNLTVPIQYNEAKIFWDKNRYVIGEQGKLTVVEPDMNKNADITEVLKVTLTLRNAKISYDLRETSPNSGIFTAQIPFVDATTKALEKEIGVSSGDIITAVYNDITLPEAKASSSEIQASAVIGDVMEFIGTSRMLQTEQKVIDENGNDVSSPKFRDSYKIESKVQNNTEESFQLEFIVQVIDENGFVEFLESRTQQIAANDTISPSIEWKPSSRGKYTVEIFVWQDLDSPSPLSKVMKKSVIVV